MTKLNRFVNGLKRYKAHIAFDFSFPYNIGAFVFNPFFFVRRNLYRHIKKNAQIMTGEMLDFGCGSKPYRNLFRNVSDYIGLDIEQSGHGHEYEKIDVYYDGTHIPFEDDLGIN